jgi:hypothetical protein
MPPPADQLPHPRRFLNAPHNADFRLIAANLRAGSKRISW